MATGTVSIPISLLQKMSEAAGAFEAFGDEMEDYLLSQDAAFLARMRQARAHHLKGETRSDLSDLDRAVAQRVIRKVEWLAEHPQVLRHPLRHLPEDLKGLHKYRVGDYRVLLWVDREAGVLTLYGV